MHFLQIRDSQGHIYQCCHDSNVHFPQFKILLIYALKPASKMFIILKLHEIALEICKFPLRYNVSSVFGHFLVNP